MDNPSKITKHQFYNLYQRLKMGPYLTAEELEKIPHLPGAYIIWIDTTPPECLMVGTVKSDVDEGLYEIFRKELLDSSSNSHLSNLLLSNQNKLKKYRMKFNKQTERESFINDKLLFQIVAITDLYDEELEAFENFLMKESGLAPFYGIAKIPASRGKKQGRSE